MFGRVTRGWRGFGAAWLLAGALELTAASAHAEEEVVRVAYEAPDSCPDEQVFIGRVRMRTAHGRFAEPGELARTFDVSLSPSAHGASFSGRIEFTDVDGARARRSVTGATCDEVSSSLALIMALSIDDRVALTQTRESPSAPSAQPAAPGAPPKEAKPSPTLGPREPSKSPAPAPLRLRWDLGLEAGVLSWVAPEIAPVFGVFGELGSREHAWSARLSAFAARQTKTVSIGEAVFQTNWLRAELCPIALPLAAHVSVAPCAAFDVGVLLASAQGDSLTNIDNQSLFWASGVALLRLSWEIRDRFILGLDAELGVPFARQDFRFNDPPPARTTTELFHVPAFGVGAKAGAAVRFP